MSTRDDQPVTVPPPAGEDDAYSATTKVGAMPADIMEKLRAEGLLPEDVEKEERAKAQDRETPVASMRPSTSLEKRTLPRPASTPSPLPAPNEGAPVPQLYSTAPPALTAEDAPASKMVTAKPPPMTEMTEMTETTEGAGEAPAASASDAIETPVAFAFPPAAQLPKLLDEASEEQKDTTALTAQKAAQKTVAKPPSKVTMLIVAALVVVLLIVALMRLRG